MRIRRGSSASVVQERAELVAVRRATEQLGEYAACVLHQVERRMAAAMKRDPKRDPDDDATLHDFEDIRKLLVELTLLATMVQDRVEQAVHRIVGEDEPDA